jgi:Fe/S biogenesis protein NfuA
MSEPILNFDEGATHKLDEMRAEGRFDGSALRISVDEEGAAFHYQIEVVDLGTDTDGDQLLDCNGVGVLVDPVSVERLRGATLQYMDRLEGAGFRFENPNKPALLGNPLAAQVQEILDQEINPGVAAHGGRVSLVAVEDTRVFVRFGGGCQGCGQADLTLKEGVVATIQRQIPEITEVLDATDHEAGDNPYYQ